ncbi:MULTISPECIES: glycosyltransferase family 2 protein [unclassified Pseudomonas]|uniref:glycosyltransferase family 2 protein n=1 Tax=unclassified Pseudomonas TaxID=196821 RepID=UPI00244919E8|nr:MULTISPECIES: glycosyltransferase family 2 protein [unclassified Pseudomonas]MDG9925378.1 glycosyltransferase family 2 protein [Pseudomonas sp. GD04045]MDH0037282.1 glycosyltransferase family 2 protein [Pseudomonas sp. GD04019]
MDSTKATSCIYGIVVTYYPDTNFLERQLRILSKQASKVILVNNGPDNSLAEWISEIKLSDSVSAIQLDKNHGLAYAQNIGIEHARLSNATHVAIFDQDSLPDCDMIPRLLAALYSQQDKGLKVAAVAPSYRDNPDSPLSGFVRTGFLGFKRVFSTPSEPIVEADFLISSGTLIPISALNEIGLMEENFFIDHIDTEWCFRALSKGYRLFGVADATMKHSLGNHRTRIWFLRWRTVPYHSPFRYYYIFRNSIILMRRSYMPLSWKVSDFSRNLRALFFYSLFSKDRTSVLKMMFKGFIDGIRNRMGRLSDH